MPLTRCKVTKRVVFVSFSQCLSATNQRPYNGEKINEHCNISLQKTKATPLLISGSHTRVKCCQRWSQLRERPPIMQVAALYAQYLCWCTCSLQTSAEVQCVCCSHSSCESQQGLVCYGIINVFCRSTEEHTALYDTLSKTVTWSSSLQGSSICHNVCVKCFIS